MKKTAFISDILFSFILSAVFTLCFFRYLGLPLLSAAFLSALCGVLLACAVGAFLQSKRKLFFLKKSDEAQKQKLCLHLALLSEEQTSKFFLAILNKIQPTRQFSRSCITTPNEFICIKCNFEPITANEIVKFYRIQTSKQRVLICLQIAPAAHELCRRLNVLVKTENDVYQMVKENDAMPTEFLGEVKMENRRALQRKLCFSKHNSKRFLVSGCLILLTSLFTPFPYYYLVFGSILLLAATFIRIFGYE